ncbi:MAG: hypothetical protein JW757_14155 [Anaerolineales bacterium]|nr:hypothetical protein [Anaerolineales bacterium]
MKKLTLMIAILVLAALACSSIRIADPAFEDAPADTPDALATVLAEVAQVTKDAPTPTDAPSTETPEEAAETPEATEVVELAENTSTPTPTRGVTGYPTAIALPNPTTSNFYTCLEECLDDGSNHQVTFPERVEQIFFQFQFEDFPIKAPYVRKWTKDGQLWAQYTCLWPGPVSGLEEISLTEPNGLASGIWTLEITVNGEKVLEQTLLIDGTYSYWSPPGYFNGCYGQK